MATDSRAQRLERANDFQERANAYAPSSATRTNYLLSALFELAIASLETAPEAKPATRTRKATQAEPEAVASAPAE